MSIVNELIRTEADGTISFGDYTLGAKAKLDNFNHKDAIYKVKTFQGITRLEKNGMFAYESVPGTAVMHLSKDEDAVCFQVEGPDDAEITLGLEDETTYEVTVAGKSVGELTTKLGGKLTVSVELNGEPVEVTVKKVN